MSVPIAISYPATQVSYTDCVGNGSITDTGGTNATQVGFCYKTGTSGDPTTSDTVVLVNGDYAIGDFSLAFTGLLSDTDYRVRSTAINPDGTGYGTTVQIHTCASSDKLKFNIMNQVAPLLAQ